MAILANARADVRANPSDEPTWQAEMQQAVRDLSELRRLLELGTDPPGEPVATASFPLFAPRPYIARMRVGDPDDPLLRQVLPVADEDSHVRGFGTDPVGDNAATLRPGLLQKYAGRVLLVVTGVCAVHCRYCFRRHYPYTDGPRSRSDWDGPLAEIAADRSIQEVILSGGDPLTLADSRLADLAGRLARISHVRRLRVHTRLPIMIPRRVTTSLIDWLVHSRLTPIVVLHANHAREIDAGVLRAIARLCDAGIPLLNQAVLLRGINDSIEAQAELCERLVDARVMPYYLHQLDRVDGAAHFEVPEAEGRTIVAGLRERLPGYAIPKYVRAIAGASAKHPL